MQTQQVVVREIPVDLWRKLKAKAAVDGSTIQIELAKAIAKHVEPMQSNAA